ncbi:solute carrier family 17 member 9 isoform X2 [Rhinatrema bivittatum]|uniref:solute carrier family 17 member 9 isoform X2 n=1 Tax=Rhinatrema bivittatum TaxID=194408 RepID=UPI001127E91F|nr:solute carrier family 17 member 9 isoform X2 [Rhinatrema bivittatum]XP_029468173.1 solute carrier family 17 member 9 isoform X2 [Rhinatrema bivittatum]
MPQARLWTVMLLLGTCLLYCARVTLPICAVAMSEHFHWNKKQSGIVLGSFFWGYCLTQIIGGHLSDKVGGEKVLLLSASAWGLLTAITPLIAHLTSVPLLFLTILRFLMGLLQGMHFPALASLFSRKVPETERAFTCSTVGSGSQFGTLLIGGVGSLLLDWYGWESVFYFAGLFTLFWVYWMCSRFCEKEHSISLQDLAKGLSLSKESQVPWRRLFKKAPVWAVIVAQLSVASTFFTLLSWLPTFFKETFPEAKGWVFNVIPWLVAIPASIFSGFLSDHLITLGFKTISIRKFMQIVGMGASSFFVFCLSRTSDYEKAIVFVSACIGLQTFNHRLQKPLCADELLSFSSRFWCSGVAVNVQDLAPSCAGFLFGVANTGGALLGVVWVYLSGYLIESTGSWTPVFHLVVGVNVVGLCVFLLFADARRVDIDSAHATRMT